MIAIRVIIAIQFIYFSVAMKMAVRSVEIYSEALQFLRKRGALLGLDFFCSKYKFWNPLVVGIVLDVITYTLITVYCIIEFFGDLEKLVFCMVTYGFGIQVRKFQILVDVWLCRIFQKTRHCFQGFAKLKTFWFSHKKVLVFNEKIIKLHQTSWNLKSSRVFEKYSRYCLLACKCCNHLYMSTGIFLIFNPIIVKLITGKLVLPFGFKLPFIDELSFFGYAFNVLHHILQAYITAVGYIFSDGLYAVIVIHIYCHFDILVQSLEELNEVIKIMPKDVDQSKMIREKLVLIIQAHQELLRFDLSLSLDKVLRKFSCSCSYIGHVEDFFRQNILVLIFSDVFQIVCSLFALVVSQWFIGMFIIVALSFQIFAISVFGTILIIKVRSEIKPLTLIIIFNHFTERGIQEENLRHRLEQHGHRQPKDSSDNSFEGEPERSVHLHYRQIGL